MSLTLIKYLLLGMILLTGIVIVGTWKLKKLPAIVNSSKSKKIEAVTLLKKLWERQLVMNVIAIVLFLISTYYDSIATKGFEMILGSISLVFIIVASVLTVTNYNKFKIEFNKVVIGLQQ